MSGLSAVAAVISVFLLFPAERAFAGMEPVPGPQAPAVSTSADKNDARMKSALVRLIRQDEYLDDTLAALRRPGRKLDQQDIAAIGFSLRIIRDNLDSVSAFAAELITEMRPGAKLPPYTRAIMSYGRSISAKSARIAGLTARAARGGKADGKRDALSSRGGARGGRRLQELAEERRAMEKLSADARALKRSSDRLAAAGKWLHIASR